MMFIKSFVSISCRHQSCPCATGVGYLDDIKKHPSTTAYYRAFQLALQSALVSAQATNGGMVRKSDNAPPASDRKTKAIVWMTSFLKSAGKHVPLGGVLLSSLGSVCKAYTHVQMQRAISRLSKLAPSAAERDPVVECIARKLALAQKSQLVEMDPEQHPQAMWDYIEAAAARATWHERTTHEVLAMQHVDALLRGWLVSDNDSGSGSGSARTVRLPSPMALEHVDVYCQHILTTQPGPAGGPLSPQQYQGNGSATGCCIVM
jgi:hypothetical protein